MTEEEYAKELASDPQLRKAIAVVNRHYGAPQPSWSRLRVLIWAVLAAVVAVIVKIAF